MRITRWGEYGILCCLYLGHKGAFEKVEADKKTSSSSEAESTTVPPIGASEIAEQQRIPTQYAQQILHRLRKGGVIKSVRGPRGGFLLAAAPEQINLRQILLAAEGETFELICEADPIYDHHCGPETDCGLRHVWQDLQNQINVLLEGRTLASVLSHPPFLPRADQERLFTIAPSHREASGKAAGSVEPCCNGKQPSGSSSDCGSFEKNGTECKSSSPRLNGSSVNSPKKLQAAASSVSSGGLNGAALSALPSAGKSVVKE